MLFRFAAIGFDTLTAEVGGAFVVASAWICPPAVRGDAEPHGRDR